MAGKVCVRCGGHRLVKGICGGGKSVGSGFQPDGVRQGLWDWNALVVGQIEPGHTACLSCGLVWFEVRPTELRELIEEKGTEEAQRVLSPPQWPPHGTDPTPA
jgi:hypothetical protein